jgi:hypothetical protein
MTLGFLGECQIGVVGKVVGVGHALLRECRQVARKMGVEVDRNRHDNAPKKGGIWAAQREPLEVERIFPV